MPDQIPAQRERQWTLYGQGPDHQVVADGPRLGWKEVLPVVPCDDAAIERAHAAMRERAGRYLTDRQIVRLVLQAARETP